MSKEIVQKVLNIFLIEKNIKSLGNIKRYLRKRYNDIFIIIDNYKGITFIQKVYNYLNDIIDIPKCEYCKINDKRFWNIKIGYDKCCSKNCKNMLLYGNINPMKNKKISKLPSETYKKKTGYKCPAANPEINKQMWKTYKKNSGYSHPSRNPNFMQNYKNKTGYNNPLSNPEIINKTKETLKLHKNDDPMFLEKMQNKIKNTCMIKYGVNYPTKNENIKLKMKQKFIKNYGVSSPTKCDKVKEKIVNTMYERYGVTCGFMVNRNNDLHYSKLSQKLFWQIYDMIDDNDKPYCYFETLNKEICMYNKEKHKGYAFDFTLLNKKKIIEFNGNYWHMNPKIYKEDCINKSRKLFAKDIWQCDQERYDFIKYKGYDLLVVWEEEYLNNTDKVIENIMSFILTESKYVNNYDI